MDSSIIAAVSAISVAVTTGFFTWLIARKKNDADATKQIQDVINDGFKLLIEQNNVLIHNLQEARQQAQIEQSVLQVEVRNLRDAVSSLEAHVISLERLLRMHDIPFKPFHVETK